MPFPGHPWVSTKFLKPNRSSRLAVNPQHIYECLVLSCRFNSWKMFFLKKIFLTTKQFWKRGVKLWYIFHKNFFYYFLMFYAGRFRSIFSMLNMGSSQSKGYLFYLKPILPPFLPLPLVGRSICFSGWFANWVNKWFKDIIN